jgi:Chromo (CHRromatin Organisation MOdifier) domain
MLTVGSIAVVALPRLQRPPLVREQTDLPSTEEFEVEDIMEMRGNKYFIKWKGYPASKNTWEPREHLTNCALLLRRFHRRRRR